MDGVDFVYTLRTNGGFLEVSLARQFRIPEGITRRVLGVWVLSFTTHFNCCPFFLNKPNCKYPSGEQLIFMSRNGNLSSVTKNRQG